MAALTPSPTVPDRLDPATFAFVNSLANAKPIFTLAPEAARNVLAGAQKSVSVKLAPVRSEDRVLDVQPQAKVRSLPLDGERLQQVRIGDDPRPCLHPQRHRLARDEKEQAGSRVLQDVGEAVGQAVAPPVGQQQRPVVEDAHEPGRVAAGRDIGVAIGPARAEEEEWRALDQCPATNVEGGQVDLLCDHVGTAVPQVTAGKIKPFAVTTKERVPLAPTVPTAEEAGLKGFELGAWYGMYVSAGTPKPVVDTLAAALQRSLQSPQVIQRFADLGTEPVATERATPAALQQHLEAEIARWHPIIEAAGVYAD